MGIQLRHLRYAFARTASLLIVLMALLVINAAPGQRTLEDTLWGAGAGLTIWACFFAYWIWRTQKKRADKPRPGEL